MASRFSTSHTKKGIPRSKSRPSSLSPPPNMLTIWILGENWEEKSSVGNFLMGKKTFDKKVAHSHHQHPEKDRGRIESQHASVFITPNLFDRQVPEVDISQALKCCEDTSAPGPHVLLLILHPERTEKNRYMMETMKSWSDDTLKHSIVVLMSQMKSSRAKKNDIDSLFRENVTYEFYKFEEKKKRIPGSKHSVTELFKKIKTLNAKNEGKHLTLKIHYPPLDIPSTSSEPQMKTVEHREQLLSAEMSTQNLHLVLFGRSSAEKTSISNIILGSTESKSETVHECVKREGVVCGHQVTLVEMPELYNTLSQKDVMHKTYRALSLCSMNIHTFLMVLPVSPLTDDDKGELDLISDIYNTADGKFWDHLMILFLWEGKREDKVITDFILNKDILQKCGDNYHIFIINQTPDSGQISELLEKINVIRHKHTCYSNETYVKAQLDNRLQRDRRIKEMENEIRELKKNKQTAESELRVRTRPNCLRIVLVGKTGCGKSATGNTILNRKAFTSQTTFKSVTSSCQKEEGIVKGTQVTVVDTPGLFDTKLSNDEVKEEILKCISLLSPGPHVFLLLLKIGRFTAEEMETLNLIKETFGKNAGMFSIIIFTHGDALDGEPIENHLDADSHIKKLISDCGGRYHVIDNKQQDKSEQVIALLGKINEMVQKNGEGCYTNEMFKEAEAAIKQEMRRILKEKEEEMEREKKHIREIHEEEMADMKRRMDEQRELMEREREVREEELRIKSIVLTKEIRKRYDQEEREKRDREKATKQRKFEVNKQNKEWTSKWQHLKNKKEELERELKKKDQEERERYERERREMEERHVERLKQEQEQEEYRERLNKERGEWELKQKTMIEEFELEKKKKEKAENQRIEHERREKEKIEREFEDSKMKMKKEREEWEKLRKEEWDKRMTEEKKNSEEEKEKLKKLKEELAQARKEDEKRKREDNARRKQEKRERQQIEKEYESKIKEMKRKHADEARKQAEEFNEFRKKYAKDFHSLVLMHDQQMQSLKQKHEKACQQEHLNEKRSQIDEAQLDEEKRQNENISQMEEDHKRQVEEMKRKYGEKCILQ